MELFGWPRPTRRLVACAVAACLCLSALAGCSEEKKPFEKPAVPVEIQAAEVAASGQALRFSASLIPRERVDLAFKVGGYVEDIAVLPGPDGAMRILQKGDPVSRGMVLARLQDKDYAASLRKAEAAREEELASLREAQVNYERYQKLYDSRVVAKSELDKAREKLDYYTASSTRSAHQIEEERIRLKDTVLASPLDSVVGARLIEKGSLVSPGTLAFTLVDLRSVKAVFGVPDYVVGRISPGLKLPVRVEALGAAVLEGEVVSVSPSADPKSRVFDVEVAVANADGRLKDGMIATASLDEGGDKGPNLLVPMRAVVRDPADPQGFVVFTPVTEGDRFLARARKVKIGDVSGNRVVLLEGLVPGQEVITVGAALLHDGEPINRIR